jgi:hypothetical protein
MGGGGEQMYRPRDASTIVPTLMCCACLPGFMNCAYSVILYSTSMPGGIFDRDSVALRQIGSQGMLKLKERTDMIPFTEVLYLELAGLILAV